MIGSKHLLSNNFLCKRGDELAKEVAASNTNMVVGNKGSIAPNTAKAINKKPEIL